VRGTADERFQPVARAPYIYIRRLPSYRRSHSPEVFGVLEAGASDYITKPVDADQLLSLLRVWLYQA